MKIIKSSFHPKSNLDNKSNYKPYYRIETDGSIFERIFLDIPDSSERERIICFHYLKSYSKLFLNEAIGFNIISRDNPWDFKIELSTKEVFNVEITSISDDESVFKKIKNEERVVTKSFEEKLPIYEIEKLNSLFPNANAAKAIEQFENGSLSKFDLVVNPYSFQSCIFFSCTNGQKIPLEILIKGAINKKELKKHSEKENTILIIDNRTIIYELSDLIETKEILLNFIESCSFREIWFYTGYCSDLDGNNADFTLVPLKIPNKQKDKLLENPNIFVDDNIGHCFI